jgi:uncharacterized protein YidB (DUF937 family)
MGGIFDAVSKLAGGLMGGQGGGDAPDHSAVAGGLLEELGGAGGVGNLIQSFQQNGAGNLIQQFASGNTGAIDPSQIESALAGTGLIDNVASRTGMSADQIKSGLGTVLPVLLHHSISEGHVTADGQPGDTPAPDAGSLLQSVLGKLA